MINLQTEKTPMTLRDPIERAKDFNEVSLGYTEAEAQNEARRCLNCKNAPCVKNCPVFIDIPSFIKKINEGEYIEAYKIISQKSCLSAVCGRVCPQESQCESECARGKKGEAVAIGRLERFVSDYAANHGGEEQIEKADEGAVQVAVIGSGPSGLSAAGELKNRGYDVTVFEALHEFGGVLTYGIPEFRLPKNIVKTEINRLRNKGVKFVKDAVIGKTLTIEELMESGFKAVYIGSGAGLPKFMDIKGENLGGVYSANEFLTRINLMKAYKADSKTPVLKSKITVVVGGGNVAMDAARCAKRLGAENVYLVYRRTLNEIPARKEEVEHAIEEGIIFKTLTNPIEILGDENFRVKGITLTEMELGEPDEKGRRKPFVKKGSEFSLECDTVIMALGTTPNPLIKKSCEGLKTADFGGIIIDAKGQTSLKGVFAGGDAVTGSATVILAMGAGKTAAEYIDEYIKNGCK